jgi:hypothetical protein
MSSFEDIRERYGNICRKCINEMYGVHLVPGDLYYQHYPYECEQCGKMANIVTGVRFKGRLKLFGRRSDVEPNRVESEGDEISWYEVD